MNIKITGWALGILGVLFIVYLSTPTAFSFKEVIKNNDLMTKITDAVVDPKKSDKIH